MLIFRDEEIQIPPHMYVIQELKVGVNPFAAFGSKQKQKKTNNVSEIHGLGINHQNVRMTVSWLVPLKLTKIPISHIRAFSKSILPNMNQNMLICVFHDFADFSSATNNQKYVHLKPSTSSSPNTKFFVFCLVRQNSLKETEFNTQEIYLTSWRP